MQDEAPGPASKSFILDCETTQEPQEQHQLQVSENKLAAHAECGSDIQPMTSISVPKGLW